MILFGKLLEKFLEVCRALNHNSTREMLEHYGASLSEPHTVGFIICHIKHTDHAACSISKRVCQPRWLHRRGLLC